MNNQQAQISVVIPSYNQPKTIDNCLQSILNQKTKHQVEVIIVDSSEAIYKSEIQAVCDQDERIQLISRKDQTFPGTARNIGIKAAKGNIIALIDSDCEADPNWIENIIANMEENTIISGVILNGTPGNVFGTCAYFVEFNHFFPFSEEYKNSTLAATCNFAAHKDVFEKVGYFTDHRAFEDILFCKRFIKIGGSVKLYKNVRITHLNRISLSHVVRNLALLGKYSASTRKEYDMPPKIVFKFPILAFLLLPFRFISILSRMNRLKLIAQFASYSPIIIYILFHWCKGFYRGSKT